MYVYIICIHIYVYICIYVYGEKGTPGHIWEDRSRLAGVPKKSLCQKLEICSDPTSADPI